MARTRIIKPDFFANDEMPRLTFPARLLFIALWTIADRRGRLEDRPLKIRRDSFPYEDINVDPLLEELRMAGFIVRYEAEGQKCIHVVNFERHQNPHKNEVESELPPPPRTESRKAASGSENPGTSHVLAPCPDPDPCPDRDEQKADPPPPASLEPRRGTVYWLRRIYRGPWEAVYGSGFFSEGRGEQTAWDRHLRDNPDPAYQAKLFDEMPRIIAAYLADQDPKLRDKKHPLPFLPERIPQYRATAPPPLTPRAPAFDPKAQSAQR